MRKECSRSLQGIRDNELVSTGHATLNFPTGLSDRKTRPHIRSANEGLFLQPQRSGSAAGRAAGRSLQWAVGRLNYERHLNSPLTTRDAPFTT